MGSIELDSMQQYVDKSALFVDDEQEEEEQEEKDVNDRHENVIKSKSVMDDALNRYSSMSFFDMDLENRDAPPKVQLSKSTKDILKNLNLSMPDSSNLNATFAEKSKSLQRRRPGLPLPNNSTSQSSPNLPSAYGVNGEERYNNNK